MVDESSEDIAVLDRQQTLGAVFSTGWPRALDPKIVDTAGPWPQAFPEDNAADALDRRLLAFLAEAIAIVQPGLVIASNRELLSAPTEQDAEHYRVRRIEHRIGTAGASLLVVQQWDDPLEEATERPHRESRRYEVEGLPAGRSLLLASHRLHENEKLRTAVLQLFVKVDRSQLAPLRQLFWSTFETIDWEPRTLVNATRELPVELHSDWEEAVRCWHYGAGIEEFLRQRAPSRLPEWRHWSETGDTRALSLLAACYQHGIGVDGDLVLAADIYRRTLKRGDWTAQVNYSQMLDAGTGVAKDEEEATRLLMEAATAGEARAQGLVGKRYSNATSGIAKDDREAIAWFEKGANGGDALSQSNFAAMLLDETPDSSKVMQAIWCFRRAAANGFVVAQHNLGVILYYGEHGVQDVEEGLVWLERAAQEGYANAAYHFGIACYQGEKRPRDLPAAWRWLEQAGSKGHADAMRCLGIMCEKGEGRPLNLQEAEVWFRRSARLGSENGRTCLRDILTSPEPPTEAAFQRRLPDGSSGWSWTSGWKIVSVACDNHSIEWSMAEDEGQTEGRAHYSESFRQKKAELLSDGPPFLVLDEVDWSILFLVLGEVFSSWELTESPSWLDGLRVQQAARWGAVELLQERFADAKAPLAMIGGRDPLYWAVRNMHFPTLRFLLDRGADPNLEYRLDRSRTVRPIQLAIQSALAGNASCILWTLKQAGADVNAQDNMGETAVHAMAQTSTLWPNEAWDFLVQAEADFNAMCHPNRPYVYKELKNGWPPLLSAFSATDPDDVLRSLHRLLDAGAFLLKLPDPLRQHFHRQAKEKLGALYWLAGARLAVRTVPDSGWLDNRSLLFHDAVAAIECELMKVSDAYIGNTPHGPDEKYAFVARLYSDRRKHDFYVNIVQRREVICEGVPIDSTQSWFVSQDRGKNWLKEASEPELELRLLCEVDEWTRKDVHERL